MSGSARDIPGLDDRAVELVEKAGMWICAPAGARVFEPGRPAEQFYLLTRGKIRVQIVAESGREVVLYRVGPGDACIMTVSCLIGQELYNGEGVVEEEVQGYAIGLAAFNQLMGVCEHFRRTILAAYSERFLDLVKVLENVAFRPLDTRLAARLLELCDEKGEVACTHQFLATDLGTAREVVSRLLKRWEDDGLVLLRRGLVQVRSREQFAKIAKSR